MINFESTVTSACLLGFSILVIFSNATPNDASGGAKPDVSNSSSGNSTDFFSGDLEADQETEETAELEKAIAELKEKECITLVGECWLLYKTIKAYLPEEQRLKVCLRRLKGFSVCEFLTDDQAEQGKEEAEQREKANLEAKAEKERKDAERKEKLVKRKEDVAARRISIKVAAEEARLEREGINITTEIPPSGITDVPVEEEVEEEPEAA